MQEKYSIGEVAKMLDISTRTLRFYDEKDLVKPAYIEENGYRFYEKEQIKQIELILFLKDIGFSLKQIKILVQDQHGKQSLELLLKQQYQENKQKINELTAKQKQIEHLQKIGVLSALTNFSDITSIMRRENKMITVRRKMWLYLIMLIIFELMGISLMYALQLGPIIVIVIAMLGAVFLSKYCYDRVEYVCPNCGEIFIPSFLAFNLAAHTPKFRKLTCPKCEKKSYCLEISRE
ncbi:MerR family transcriptional regulator [Lactobacillus hominis]|uniref:Transcriptional regulator, MerR family n=1 Tax=Lactobacillus hominis DSM 23910 = CRBIP 24.179 TaxID=1423758 RepID=I7IW17_9LACO|nr:MerR family transcriptional regulator [Lactobacillus hominis]KRM84961.1 transcriptional regulator, MerR family [Lactobacillus hominis DSM 23910 = CRBIP 24.179]MCT3348019.1 MerR family transcriptional regulator [Lactobacillus hominis]CCI82413.1 Transcriptional regulator, MerR family [Lactobacillus hominis DSM 23910 = CRBIP 24.179]